jgi:alkylhydroperoxidase/carboxymuconolactone decarboxylase family protein YurZ
MTNIEQLRRIVNETPSSAESFFLPLLAQANIRQDDESFEILLKEIRLRNMSRQVVVEALLQCCLFDGYPAALEGLERLSRLWPADADKLVEDYSPTQVSEWRRRGEELCQRIYGDSAPSLIRNVTALSPDLGNWFLVEGYGRVLSRQGLKVEVRELITVAILLWKGYPRQLLSHVRGALRVGMDGESITALLRLCSVHDEQLRTDALSWCIQYENEFKQAAYEQRS